MSPGISVLMSVYKKERPEFLADAMSSLFRQTRLPDEMVLIKDGPLTDELEDVLKRLVPSAPFPIHVLALDMNKGLGIALQAGLQICNFEFIARMDSDDLNLPERFFLQYQYLTDNPSVAAASGPIFEFSIDPLIVDSVRGTHSSPDSIAKIARYRNPINHMAVMFRRSTVIRAGGYQAHSYFEDYWLWARLLNSGSTLGNLDVPLVLARTGAGMIERRRGLRYLQSEAHLYFRFWRIGFLRPHEAVFIGLSRIAVRLLPKALLSAFYSRFLRRSLTHESK